MNFFQYKAIISLFPINSGGRMNPIKNEYSPNAVFGMDISTLSKYWTGDKYHFDEPDNEKVKNSGVKIDLGENIIYPGTADTAIFKLSERSAIYLGSDLLQAKTVFLIREGSRVVGTGLIK
jgi:hypothetical protein